MPSAPTCSEQDLIAAVRRGDDRAFEELYSRYGRRINAYVQGLVRDHGRAEDITQEVFISALRRMRHSERRIAFKPWIYEIAKNACIDEFRRTKRSQEVLMEGDDGLASAAARLITTAPTPERAAENRQQLTDLKGAFRGLSDRHHKLIVMRELEGLSYSEIGNRMGMSQAVVESSLFRARRRLTEEYGEIVTGRRCEQVRAVVDRPAAALRRLGLKERRLVARHLSHCQACRLHAHLAGVEDSLLGKQRPAGKIAALLPIPAWLRWRSGAAAGRATVASRAHSFGIFRSAQALATAGDPSPGFDGFGRAAAAAAALVIAGAGGGIVTGLGTGSPARRAVHAGLTVSSRPPLGSSATRSARYAGAVFGAPIATASRLRPFGTASGIQTRSARSIHSRTPRHIRARAAHSAPRTSHTASVAVGTSTPAGSASASGWVGNGQLPSTGLGSFVSASNQAGSGSGVLPHISLPSIPLASAGTPSAPSTPSGTPSAPSAPSTPSGSPATPSPSSVLPSIPSPPAGTQTTPSLPVVGSLP
jgi:RNA polymerase sigma factor (sigma-70 family)